MSNRKLQRNPFDYFVEKGSDADPFYQSILELDKRLNEEKVPHILRRLFDGWQILYPSEGGIDGDIISHFGSYGREQDLLEAYGFNLQGAEGWMTVEEAFNLIKCFDKNRRN